MVLKEIMWVIKHFEELFPEQEELHSEMKGYGEMMEERPKE